MAPYPSQGILLIFFLASPGTQQRANPSKSFADSHAESMANSSKSEIKAQVDVVLLRYREPESTSARRQ